jgi:hypothetical protein
MPNGDLGDLREPSEISRCRLRHEISVTRRYAGGVARPERLRFALILAAKVAGAVAAVVLIVVRRPFVRWARFAAGTLAGNAQLVGPIIVCSHDQGACSVTAGYVYCGRKVAAAVGRYFYGDWYSGSIWSLRVEDGRAVCAQGTHSNWTAHELR